MNNKNKDLPLPIVLYIFGPMAVVMISFVAGAMVSFASTDDHLLMVDNQHSIATTADMILDSPHVKSCSYISPTSFKEVQCLTSATGDSSQISSVKLVSVPKGANVELRLKTSY